MIPRQRIATFISSLLFVLLIGALVAPASQSATRRALLVGIDIYQPEIHRPAAPPAAAARPPGHGPRPKPSAAAKGRDSWIDLDGAVNDVDALRALLIARFGFRDRDILVLKNGEATRENIQAQIREHLLKPAVAGDVGIFYYAGHGSQVRNTRSTSPDGLDQTIVPADSYQGVFDVRNKELARLFNEVVDKGVILTAIFDSCHSGGIARGVSLYRRKSRHLPPDPREVADPYEPSPAPEERGALVLSAALDFQVAGEDEDQGVPHGLFTLTLLKVLRYAPVDESAEAIFKRVKAIMQADGPAQEPVLAGTAARRNQPLFGVGTANLRGPMTVAVQRVEAGKRILLQGGRAVGLSKRSELKRIGGSEGGAEVRIRITEVDGIASAVAEVIKGDPAAIRAGDLFEVDRWVAPNGPSLRVWMPPATLKSADLKQLGSELAELRHSDRLRWIDDPTLETPTHVLSWDGSAWQLSTGGSQQSLGVFPTAGQILDKLPATGRDRARLFVDLPPPAELADELHLGPGTDNSAIQVMPTRAGANYYLVGRLGPRSMEYAWVLPDSTAENAMRGLPLPIRTDWLAVAGPRESHQLAATALEDLAVRIGRIKSWLQADAPSDRGEFPYRLALKNSATGAIKADGVALANESYGLVLLAEGEQIKRGVEPRFVYVFSIDGFGNSELLFPRRGGGNVKNHIPYAGIKAATEIPLGPAKAFQVGPPYGVTSYIMLTSREPLPDPDILAVQGVRTRAIEINPLVRMIKLIGAPVVAGSEVAVPTDWSLDRVTIRSSAAR